MNAVLRNTKLDWRGRAAWPVLAVVLLAGASLIFVLDNPPLSRADISALFNATEPASQVVTGQPRAMYVNTGNDITVLDPTSGRVLHRITGLQQATTSILLATAPTAKRFFVTEADFPSGHQVNYVNVYRTTDWKREQHVEVPDIIRYPGSVPHGGIEASPDGNLLYVYHYVAELSDATPYWLTVLDVNAGTWRPERYDLPGCGAAQLFASGPATVYIVCAGGALWTVNSATHQVARGLTVTPLQQRSSSQITRVAAATERNGKLFVVTDNRELHVLDPVPGTITRLGTTPGFTDKIVPLQSIGVDPQGTRVVVPTGTTQERSHGLGSEISVLDVQSGATVQTVHLDQPFRGIAFSPDASTAFVAAVDADGYGRKLIRVNLQSGDQTPLLTGGSVFPGFVLDN